MSITTPPNEQAFNQAVWQLVRQVPRGAVATYGQIAQMVEVPSAVSAETYQTYGSRWVGNAMAASPDDVPWQRIINAQGKISLRDGALRQKLLLEQEGVEFVGGKVNLRQYQWGGPGSEPPPKQGKLF